MSRDVFLFKDVEHLDRRVAVYERILKISRTLEPALNPAANAYPGYPRSSAALHEIMALWNQSIA